MSSDLAQSLIAHVTNHATNKSETFAFDSSPVRLGRNPLNEMTVSDSTVSQWHGLFRFDERELSYVDLGSTNGTALNGTRVRRNESIALQPGDLLQISRIDIKLSRAKLPKENLSSKQCTFFAESEERDRTMMMEAGSALAAAVASLKANAKAVDQLTLQCSTAYEKYTGSLNDAVEHLALCLEQLPAAQRGPTMLALKKRLPALAETSAFRKLGGKLGLHPEQLGHVDIEEWLGRLLYGLDGADGAKGKFDVHDVMPRLGAILETFAQAYLDLQDGHQQFLAGMGIRLNTDAGEQLAHAGNAREALAYLLKGDGKERMRELHRAFADLALHQVGLLNGVVEGVRGLLGEIRPESIAGLPDDEDSGEVRRGSGGGFFGSRVKQWWRDYAEKYGELLSEERFTRHMFGKAFSRAYLTIMGSTGDTPRQVGPSTVHPAGGMRTVRAEQSSRVR